MTRVFTLQPLRKLTFLLNFFDKLQRKVRSGNRSRGANGGTPS